MSVIYIVEVDVLLEWLWVLISVFDFVSRLKFIKIHFLYWVAERQKALYMFYKCSVDNSFCFRDMMNILLFYAMTSRHIF